MKFYLGVTNISWYNYLSRANPEDINFWQPGGSVHFKVIEQGAPFLFKLKKPANAIGGVGFFAGHSFLPLDTAWDVFGNRNGCESLQEFRSLILTHRNDKQNTNPQIGCIILTSPVFFNAEDWIAVPDDWSNSIVQGKSYDTNTIKGSNLWMQVEHLLREKYLTKPVQEKDQYAFQVIEDEEQQYGSFVNQRVRLGQGAFRALVIDAYTRRCAVSGEKTLPVLEAAHIKPYTQSGPHHISNGILLRSDMHKLFDTGYITINEQLRVEVSKRIKEEFQNGREYYQYHGKSLLILPSSHIDRPAPQFIEWHNDNIYKG